MILGLALSMDDRFAAAYTINKQLVIIDIMLGHYIKVERVRTMTTSSVVTVVEFHSVADETQYILASK